MAAVPGFALTVLPGLLSICRLGPDAAVPAWALAGGFFSVTRTGEELSIVCEDARVPAGATVQRGWRALMVQGPLDFALTGILSRLLAPLAAAKVSIFALSTYDTDYILVKEGALPAALAALRADGHTVKE